MAHAQPEDASASRISFKRFTKANPTVYFGRMYEEEPHRRDRHSDQTWLPYRTPLLRALRKRAMAVSGVTERIINNSESLQVVRYEPGGHYACHHDSSPDSIGEGIARFATLGMFLNTVERGGE